MTTWYAGDIISDEKWNSLNSDIIPYAKKVEWYDEQNHIFNIQYIELINLLQHGCIVWYIDQEQYIYNIDDPNRYYENIDGRAKQISIE